MRLTSAIWVAAYLRRCSVESVPAVVLRRGHKDAGAIFIEVDRLDGTVDLYVPAPAGVSETDSERFWVRCFEGDAVSEERVNSYVLRQMDFDPDMWVIAIEDKQGRHFLGDALIPT